MEPLRDLLLVASGIVLKASLDWLADRRLEKRTKRERRDSFEHDALVALQEAAVRLARSVESIVSEQRNMLSRAGQWLPPSEFPELLARQQETFDAVRINRDRTQSSNCRTLGAAFLRECQRALEAENDQRAVDAVARCWDAYESLSTAVGNVIRGS